MGSTKPTPSAMDIDMVVDTETMGSDSKTRIKLQVEMYGDIVCPWCYIGKKSLDRAIETYAAKYPDDVFDVVWKPFILWPNLGVSSYDKPAPILKMFGPLRAPGVFERLEKNAAEYDIHFNWEGRSGNSRDANKLVVLAYEMDQKIWANARNSKDFSSPDPATATTTPPQRYKHPHSPVVTTETTTISSLYSNGKTSPVNPMDIDPTSISPTNTDTANASPPSSLPSSPITTSSTPFPVHPPPALNPPIHQTLNKTQDTFLSALFHATFTQGFDPSDRSFLVSLALSMNPPLANSSAELIAYLDSEDAELGTATPRKASVFQMPGSDGRTHHQQQQQHHLVQGEKKDAVREIGGVPSVLIQGKYRVGGMQKSEVYLSVFERVREGVVGKSRAGVGSSGEE